MTSGLDLGLFRRTRISHVRQAEMAECGIACLAMIADFHGLRTDLPTLRRELGSSLRGMSLRSVMGAAERLGMSSRAVRVEMRDLRNIALPAILHWDLTHYVVVEAVGRTRALIHDPAGRSAWLSLSHVSRHFTGVALEIEPSVEFRVGDLRPRVRLSHLWGRMRGFKRAVAQTVLLSAFLQAFQLASPYYLQLAIDKALPSQNAGLLATLAIGFALFAILNAAASILRQAVLLSVGSTFGYALSSNVLRHLLRLPIRWFASRPSGDILSRMQSVAPIRRMLAEDAPAVLIDSALAMLTLVIMLVYSPTLTAIALLALAAAALIRAAMFRALAGAQEEGLVANGREQSVVIETIRNMRALRLANREGMRHALWQARMTESVNSNVRSQRLTNWQTTLQAAVFSCENVVTVFVGVLMVMRGGFSVGMLVAYLTYKSQFLAAGSSLIGKASDFRLLGLHLERLSDIVATPEDFSFDLPSSDRPRMRGRIELADVSFRYEGEESDVFRRLDLVVEAGSSVVITGPSGCGKSTLLQIVLGLAEPTEGEMLVDGKPVRTMGFRAYYDQVGAVLQDDTLFSGTLADNIAMFAEAADQEDVMRAARTAAIHDDIVRLPMGYDTFVGESGSTLSGGQRQRVLLARALFRNPALLVLDEGTSHLDAAKEAEVSANVAALGITRIMVAHRRETIATADLVYRFEAGRLVEVRSSVLSDAA